MTKTIKKTLATVLSVLLVVPAITCPAVTVASAEVVNPVIFENNFENYDAGTDVSTLNLNNIKVVKDAPGSSVTVENDSVSGGKAIKITQTKQTPAAPGSTKYTGIQVLFGDIIDPDAAASYGDGMPWWNVDGVSSGIVDIDFKLRIEGDVTATLPWDLLWTTKSSSVSKSGRFGLSQFEKKLQVYKSSTIANDLTAGYAEFHIEFDVSNKTYSLSCTANGQTLNPTPSFNYNDFKDFDSLNLIIGARGGSNHTYASYTEGATNNPVYWIDDISVKKRAVEVTNVTRNADKSIDIDFNEPIDTETYANSTYFKVKNVNDAYIDTNDYTVSVVDTDTVKISGVTTNCKVEVVGGITSTTANVLPMYGDYTSETLVVEVFYLGVDSVAISSGNIDVIFNEDIAEASATTTNFVVTNAENDKTVTGYSVARTDTKKVTISDLPYGKFKVTVKTGVAVADGSEYQPMQADYTSNVLKKNTPNVLIDEDFNDYAEGTELTDISDKFIVTKDAPGSSVNIQNDATNSTKAIKITQTKQTPAGASATNYTGFQFALGELIDNTIVKSVDGVDARNVSGVKSGILDIYFKMRIEGPVTGTLSWDLFHGSNASTSTGFLGVLQTEGQINSYQTKEQIWAKDLNNAEGRYAEFHIAVDWNAAEGTSSKITVTCLSDELRQGKPNVNMSVIKDIDTLNLLVGARNNNGNTLSSSSNNPVYWIDDLKILYREVELENIYAQPSENKIDMVFNTEIADADLTNGNIEILAGETALTKDTDYTLAKSGRTVTATLANALTAGEAYTVNVKAGIEAVNTSYEDMQLSHSKTVTVPMTSDVINIALRNASGVRVADIAEFANETVNVKGKITTDETGYMLVIAVKDASGKLVSTKILYENELTDGAVNTTIAIPTDATNDYKVEGFLWNAETIKPLESKIELYKKKVE